MKKMFSAALALILCTVIIVPACNASSDFANVRPESSLIQENIAVVSNPVNFQLVGDVLMTSNGISFMGADVERFKACEMDGNYLFSEESFSSVLNQAGDLKKAIYDGNIIGIFEPTGIDHEFEKELSLPIQFVNSTTETESEIVQSITVGRLYGVDDSGALMAAEITVPVETDSTAAFEYFTECANDFNSSRQVSRSTGSNELIGVASKYMQGLANRGQLRTSYEVYYFAGPDGDYYPIHGYLYASPEGEYQVNSFSTTLNIFGDNAVLYKHGPSSSTSATTYSVSITPKSVSDVSSTYTWSREIPDHKIVTTSDNYGAYWNLSANVLSDGEITFEPGGTVKCAAGGNFTVHCDNTMTVYGGVLTGTLPVVDATYFFICDAGELSSVNS